MSQWTHVAGILRIDAFMHDPVNTNINDCVENQFFPEGSEGPVEYKYTYAGYQGDGFSSLVCGTLAVWGDLRDYDYSTEVFNWVVDIIKRLGTFGGFVREVAVVVDVEFKKRSLITVVNSEIVMIDLPKEEV